MHNQKDDSSVNAELDNKSLPITNHVDNKNIGESAAINNSDELGFLETMSLSDLTPDQLRTLEERAKKEREDKEKETLIEAWQMFVEAANEAGHSITEALSICNPSLVKGAKKVGEIKYRDPDNKEKGWTGRGRKPTWFIEKLEQGITEKQMRV